MVSAIHIGQQTCPERQARCLPFGCVIHLMMLLHHHVAGTGLPLVLLHGLGSSGGDWELQVPVFSRRYTVITPDLPGHGQSPGPSGRHPFTIWQVADDVAALIAQLACPGPLMLEEGRDWALGAGPVHVLGLSLGGCVAVALAIRHPQLVRSLVLVNTFARFQPAGLRGAGRMVRGLWLLATGPMPRLAAAAARDLFPKPEQRRFYEAAVTRLGRISKRNYWAATRAAIALDLRPQLAQIACPTLVIAGDRDLTVPRAAIDGLRRGISGAKLALVADSGHATPVDQTGIFNRLVLDFLACADSPLARRPT
jgi:pimeloyl-ACP methyl ester carboxylesterase